MTNELVDVIRRRLRTESVFLYENGRGAMVELLRGMAAIAPRSRDTVILPSYTCYSVAASAILAGLRVRISDINPDTLGYCEQSLNTVSFENVLAIVCTSLYGIPANLSWVEEFARSRGVFLVDDAAQCLGATADGRPVGSFGNAGLLSLDKGKVVTSINGGVIVSNNTRLGRSIKRSFAETPEVPSLQRSKELVKLIAYSAFLRPSFYWIPANFPGLGLGRTVYDDRFPIRRYYDRLAFIALGQINRIDEINSARREKAKLFQHSLAETDIARGVQVISDSNPIYLRYPVLVRNAAIRHKLLRDLRRMGCTHSYPCALADVPELQGLIDVKAEHTTGGRTVAKQILTLPTHDFVSHEDIENIASRILASG